MKAKDDIDKNIPWELVLKVLKNTAEEEEKSRFDAWVEASERHGRLWSELQQTWDDVRQLNSDYHPDVLRAWQQVVEKTKGRRGRTRFASVFWRVAAACILILTGVAMGVMFQTSSSAPATYTQYETRQGKSLLTLPDGTLVWLNARSSLKFSSSFGEKERQVALHGEAFFDVMPNSDIPFIVDAGDLQIRVRGTRFNVQSFDNRPQASVSLLEGSVELRAEGMPVTLLEPGFVAAYDRRSKALDVSPRDALVALWASGELRIVEKSLSETALMLEHWYGISIEVAPELKSSQFYTLTARHESPAELLAVMQRIGRFQYRIDERGITIY